MNTCERAFRKFEMYGFEFGGNYVHFRVNIPKKYSVTNAQIMLKSGSSK